MLHPDRDAHFVVTGGTERVAQAGRLRAGGLQQRGAAADRRVALGNSASSSGGGRRPRRMCV
jgi:hypothetical protein